jgi:acetylornithine deacetylase/succinyl-diaminopimelate desuccinylase-like protein
MNDLNDLKQLYEKVRNKGLEDFKTFLKFPSISSDPDNTADVAACCNWLADYLRSSGLEVDIWDTDGHPTIFASYEGAGPDKPTLLLYHHYDVQPVEPLEEWKTPPFEPTIKDGEIYARGAQDNKGQCFYSVLAITSLLKAEKSLPINVKLLIEGEEEIGSPNLPAWLEKKKEELKADYLAVVDVGMRDKSSPAVTVGVRGMLTMELVVDGTKTDLHSGTHGGVAFNPNHALVQILAQLRDPETGKITVPGFYDDVEKPDEEEKKLLALDFPDKEYFRLFGQKPTGGEKKYTLAERAGLRPTLEINGISGGFTGLGFKTVIPARAAAKISCRLVPNQRPEVIGKLVADHIKRLTPEGIETTLHINPGTGLPLRTNPHSTIAGAFATAYQEIFGKPVEFIVEGGSIPITSELAEACGGEAVFAGLGLADDQIHAPNEHFGLDRLEKGFLSVARVLSIIAEKKQE